MDRIAFRLQNRYLSIQGYFERTNLTASKLECALFEVRKAWLQMGAEFIFVQTPLT